jgi:hypothetical protein
MHTKIEMQYMDAMIRASSYLERIANALETKEREETDESEKLRKENFDLTHLIDKLQGWGPEPCPSCDKIGFHNCDCQPCLNCHKRYAHDTHATYCENCEVFLDCCKECCDCKTPEGDPKAD